MKKHLLTIMLAVILGTVTVSVASAQGGGTIHYVTFGESLSGIAARYGVSTQAIMQNNRLTNADLVYVGQPLTIPGHAGSYTTQGCADYHIVTAGETLSDIAFSYGLTLNELLTHNNLYNSDLVYVGQSICMPATPGYNPQSVSYQSSHTATSDGHYHTITGGETLHLIASRYGVNYGDIMRMNKIANPSFIMSGQRLFIPGYQPAPTPPLVAYNKADQPVYSDPIPPHVHGAPAPVVKIEPPAAYGGGYSDGHTYDDGYSDGPAYDDGYSDGHTYDDGYGAGIPNAPEYTANAARPLLPNADQPIEIVINGGINWVGDSDTIPDPVGITTLVVQTGNEFGLTVRARSGDYEVKGESDSVFMGEFGAHRFVFRYIPPGDYDVWIDDPNRPSEVVKVKVSSGDRVTILFDEGVSALGPTYASPNGWVLASWDNPSKPAQNIGGWSNILVQTPASGLWVKIESEGGGYQAKCFTGSKGPGSCDFAGLRAGFYWIWIDGTDLTVKTYMDGAAYAQFSFDRQPTVTGENVIGPVSYDP